MIVRTIKFGYNSICTRNSATIKPTNYAGNGISDTLAMAIGDNFNPTELAAYDWALMAYECQLNPKLVSRELKQLADKICSVWPRLQDRLLELGAEISVLEGMGDIFFSNAAMPKSLRLKSLRFLVTC